MVNCGTALERLNGHRLSCRENQAEEVQSEDSGVNRNRSWEAVQMEVRTGQGRNKDGPALEAEGVNCGSGGTEMS